MEPTVEVPDVVGFDGSDAGEMLRAVGLVPYGPAFGPAPVTGTVVAQDPEALTVTEHAGSVTLWTHGDRTADARVDPTPAEPASQPEPPD